MSDELQGNHWMVLVGGCFEEAGVKLPDGMLSSVSIVNRSGFGRGLGYVWKGAM